MVAKIATGELEEEVRSPSGRVRSGKAGAAARAKSLTAEERQAIAKRAATVRWSEMEGRGAMESRTECGQLADRFRRMAEGGLVDVKFFLSNAAEAATEQVCQEVNDLYRAVDDGKLTRLDFADSHKR